MVVSHAVAACTPHCRDSRIALQGLCDYSQRRLCLALDVFDAIGYIFGLKEGGYAVIDACAQLVERQRGIRDEGVWESGGRVHCERRANVDIRRG